MWYYAQDGRQAGPLTKQDLQAMLGDGRLGTQTPVWRAGMGQWMAAHQLAELMEGVRTGPPAAMPAGMAHVLHRPTNGLALTSMVLGICSIVMAGVLTAIPAVICGHIARRQLRTSATMQSGEGMAITGLILGYLVIVLTIVAIAIVLVFFGWLIDELFETGWVAPAPPGGPAPVPGSPPAPPSPSSP